MKTYKLTNLFFYIIYLSQSSTRELDQNNPLSSTFFAWEL